MDKKPGKKGLSAATSPGGVGSPSLRELRGTPEPDSKVPLPFVPAPAADEEARVSLTDGRRLCGHPRGVRLGRGGKCRRTGGEGCLYMSLVHSYVQAGGMPVVEARPVQPMEMEQAGNRASRRVKVAADNYIARLQKSHTLRCV